MHKIYVSLNNNKSLELLLNINWYIMGKVTRNKELNRTKIDASTRNTVIFIEITKKLVRRQPLFKNKNKHTFKNVKGYYNFL